MRQHFYNFAHKVLPSDVTTQPALWSMISGDKAHSYLQMRWSDAAPASDAQPSKGLMCFQPVDAYGVVVRVVRMPPPEDVSEAYYCAIAKSEDGAIRYFVCEKGGSSVFWAEWRKNMRIRGEALQERAAPEVDAMVTEDTSPEAPWELSRRSMPGMPYLSSFLMAVFTEMVNKDANADAKAALPGAPPKAKAPKASALSPLPPSAASSNRQPSTARQIVLVVGAVAAIVALLLKFFA
jgi:hypothetical protein